MENIIKGRLYLERKELIKFPKEIVVSVLDNEFIVDNFVLIKKTYYINNGAKIDNVLYEFDINNKTNIEKWLIKDEVQDEVKRYVITNEL